MKWVKKIEKKLKNKEENIDLLEMVPTDKIFADIRAENLFICEKLENINPKDVEWIRWNPDGHKNILRSFRQWS